MNFNYIKYLLLLPVISLSSLSCSSSYSKFEYTIKNNQYDGEFPYPKLASNLEQIGNSIYRVNSIAFYESYIFSDSSKYNLSDLNTNIIQTKSLNSTIINRTELGTGTMIYSVDGTVGILTCAHVVNYPDTIVTYFARADGVLTNKVQSISFKTKENVYVAGLPEGSNVDVVLLSSKLDIALLGRKFGSAYTNRFSSFNYPFGSAKDLTWGTFVYLFGFPLNYKMLSRAIVSNPDFDGKGSFFIDASINHGYSGGIILALRGAAANFELVGMIDWVPENGNNVLEPAPIDESQNYSPLVPYKGDIFVNRLRQMKYGIARAISIEAIKKYLAYNMQALIDYGFDKSIVR